MHPETETTVNNLIKTARMTGVLYLLLGLTGMAGFLLVKGIRPAKAVAA